MDVLNSEIRCLKGVGEKRVQQLNRLGVYNIYDLFYFFPRRYVDYSNPYEIAFAPIDVPCAIKATVLKTGAGVKIKGGMTIYKIVCADDTARLNLTYFNAEYTVKRLEVGKEYVFWGRANGNMLTKEMTSPTFIDLQQDNAFSPIYPLTSGISAGVISKLVLQAIEQIKQIPDFMPNDILQKYSLCSLDFAIKSVHNPQDEAMLSQAKNRLIFDEFFMLQLGITLMGESEKRKTSVSCKKIDMQKFYQKLPFRPTNAQVNSIEDCLQDFKSGMAMNRLLQGDVGCGKTLVAAAVIFNMAQNGYQSCMLAPTEILAVQHYQSLQSMFSAFGIKVSLLTASAKTKEKREILQNLADGTTDILVGTHAILNDKVVFKSLGLCITDEQHRFGVAQRTMASQKGDNPHILVMSATPIPRTLAMIIYGNMGISVIDEMPVGRKPIETYLVGTDKRERMFGFINKHIQQERQAYIVLPAIDDSENMTELQSVNTYYNEVIKQLLPNARTSVLHGKMKGVQKDEIMQKFKQGEIDVLCSTTVIEVGVDVPNAVIMIIENAERYGLSALHQLRGRVGRGSEQSFCILVSDSKSNNVKERLKFLSATQDGFKVSKYDLDNRGPGDFFGKRQHGLPALKIADMAQDIKVLEQSKQACENLLKNKNWQQKYPQIKARLQKLFEGFVL